MIRRDKGVGIFPFPDSPEAQTRGKSFCPMGARQGGRGTPVAHIMKSHQDCAAERQPQTAFLTPPQGGQAGPMKAGGVRELEFRSFCFRRFAYPASQFVARRALASAFFWRFSPFRLYSSHQARQGSAELGKSPRFSFGSGPKEQSTRLKRNSKRRDFCV